MTRNNTTFLLGALVGVSALLTAPAFAGGGRISLSDIEAVLSDLASNQYEPFKVDINGGLCDAIGSGTSNPRIVIDSDGADGTFSVTSISARTSGISNDPDFRLTLNRISVDNVTYEYRTSSLVADSQTGSAADESFNILGAALPANSPFSAAADQLFAAGTVPHELVAQSAGNNDIDLQFFCRSDDINVSLLTIQVTGWKRASDTVSVTYIE